MDILSVSHIRLTVSDAERARAFYAGLLGFDANVIQEGPQGIFVFPVGDVYVYVGGSPQLPPGDRFSEFRIGLDHVSFNVSSKEALEALAAKLIAAGVDTKGVEQYAPSGNWYVAFRDPDNIQLEFWLP